jgi:predicted Zn-dependent peptidase
VKPFYLGKRLLFFLFFPFFLFFLWALGFSHAQPSEGIPLRVGRHTLENGMRVLLVPEERSSTVATFIQFKVGSVSEHPGATGMSHFLEHMLFKGSRVLGTKDYEAEAPLLKRLDGLWYSIQAEEAKGEAADAERLKALDKEWNELKEELRGFIVEEELWTLYLEHGAAHLNASTGKDTTQYYVSLPSNKLELWAWLEVDRFLAPVLRDYYPERLVVMEERRMRYDNQPEGALYENLYAAAFLAHPYRQPIVGWMSDLENMRIEDLYEFFRTHYAPNNAVAVLVGDVDPKTTLPMLKRYFEKWPAQAPPRPVTTREPVQHGERRVAVEFPAKPQVVIGYHQPGALHPSAAVFDALPVLLTGGRTSRLYRRLVEKDRIASHVESESWPSPSRYPTLFSVLAVPRGTHTTEELEAAVYEELARLAEDGVENWEIEKARNTLEAQWVKKMGSPMELAALLASYETLGGFEYGLERRKRYRTLTSSDVQRVVRKYLTPDNRTVVSLVETEADGAAGEGER